MMFYGDVFEIEICDSMILEDVIIMLQLFMKVVLCMILSY